MVSFWASQAASDTGPESRASCFWTLDLNLARAASECWLWTYVSCFWTLVLTLRELLLNVASELIRNILCFWARIKASLQNHPLTFAVTKSVTFGKKESWAMMQNWASRETHFSGPHSCTQVVRTRPSSNLRWGPRFAPPLRLCARHSTLLLCYHSKGV